jgi:ankyrin repeat protein
VIGDVNVRNGFLRRVAMVVAVLSVAVPAAAQSEAHIRDAATRGVAAITAAQKVWANSKQVCASCHHQFQPAHAFQAAREHGIPVDESIARADAATAFSYADLDRAIQYTHVIEPAVDDALRLVAADAAGVKPNLATAVYVKLLISRQNADGTWDSYHQRPPTSYSRVTFAALGLRAVDLFHHPSQAAAAAARVARARRYLETQKPDSTEERAYQLIGLGWAGAPRSERVKLAAALKAQQQADGGWRAIRGRTSDIYSTAQSLVALHRAGEVAPSDPSWQRGIAYLLKAQAADGTWRQTSRLFPPAPLSPPYFDGGYPGEHDQFISLSAASWAVMALCDALGPAPAGRSVSGPLPGVEPADVEPWEETLLFGTVADVRRLLDEGLSPGVATKSGGVTALMAAAPDADKMQLLLDRGADVNAKSKVRFTALMVAAQYQGSDAAMNLLLDRGARAGLTDGEESPVFNANAFFIASYAGNAAILKRLAEAGANTNLPLLLIGTSRETPMLGAFKFGDMDVAKALLDLGAPVDFADGNGITMLGRTVLNNDLPMARLMLARGADVNHVDKLGMTPLLWASAIDFGDSQMIALLLGAGARADARNKDGLTPAELARAHGNAELSAALASAQSPRPNPRSRQSSRQ